MVTASVEPRACVRSEKMRVYVILCVCVLVQRRVSSETVVSETDRPCDALYRDGVEAYLEERWQDCIDNFERALSVYRTLKQATVNCRIKCHEEGDESRTLIAQKNIDDLQFFEKTVRQTLCLLKCGRHNPKGGLNGLPKDVQKEFEVLKPYEYLQLCYYQKNLLQKAASAVFTYLVTNPESVVMQENLKFYSNLPEVDINQVVNFEAKNYVSLYIHGSEAYQHEDYKSVINYIEESLQDYLRGEEECRAYCEGPFDQGWFPDFVSSIAIGNVKKACEAVASYLIFYPADETMLNNKQYYTKLPQVEKDFFAPREEAIRYVKRQEYEVKLLDFIETEFVFQDGSENRTDGNATENKSCVSRAKDSIIMAAISKLKLFPPPIIKFEWPKYEVNIKPNTEEYIRKYRGNMIKEKLEHKSSVRTSDEELARGEMRRRKERAVGQLRNAAVRNVRAVMGERELRGKYRFVAEGFANESECNKMMELAQVAAVQGDGYSGNKSPHTNFERFEGVSLGRTALLVYLGLIEADILDLYLNLSEMGRDYLERYFNLKSELYFTYTHLVCRTALNESLRNRSDMSHAVHADNCKLLESGECLKVPPAYTWRDFSAILYLNEDFEGGEFIFVTDLTAKNVQSLVKPRCGRLVGFSAGSENLHGVRGVLRGRRCALGLWFTFSPFYEEIERVLAKQVLLEVRRGGSITDQLLHELEKHVPAGSGTSRTEELLQRKDRHAKENSSPQQKFGETLASRKSHKIQIERHKNENMCDLYMPHEN
ncbi:prolyl 3-hydroxylase 1-like isoform X2 [Zootermopsis nevadensis]|uniref:prolyl 3-hydroxylase 1-like isoform X2 n=1 Tax=Zootermopsis nevadensis TaxID=136037 RepID=UPI000B8EBF50|nr:prolyl 3-hydroxylase 1-like isoform X2 [Zootermopsis nevadensis]